jgi:hypothetical protein
MPPARGLYLLDLLAQIPDPQEARAAAPRACTGGAAAPVSDRAVRPVRAVSFADSLVGATWDPGQFAYLILLWNVESG